MVLTPTDAQAAGTGEAAGVVKVDSSKPVKPEVPGKPGESGKDPCLVAEKPGDKTKPADKTKPGEKAGSNGKAEGKPGDKGKPTGVLVCGDIAKTSEKNGSTALVLKTAKGPVTVLMTHDTVIMKGGVEQPRSGLKVGVPVAVKGELSKSGTVKAIGILLR